MSEIEQAYDGIDDMFPPSRESIKSLEYVLDILEAMEMIDRIDPNNNIYPDNDGGVEIVYTTDDLYSVVIDVKNNFIVLSSCNKDESVLYISDDKYTPIKIANKIGKYVDYVENKCDNPLRKKWASIIIDIYDEGLRFKCDDIGEDLFIKNGDVDTLLTQLNNVCDICDPDVTFRLTEDGEKLLQQINEENEHN